MPKEITYAEDATFLLMPNGDEISEHDFDPAKAEEFEGGKWRRRGVQVGWMRDRHVEIGAASFDPSREMPKDGVFMTLNRDGVNRLIRSLRKARDSAFGRDE